MYKEYLIYLASIFLLAIIIGSMILIKSRKKEHLPQKVQPINCGNISVLFDPKLNVTIIPYIKDIFGNGKATKNVVFLKSPYDGAKLGDAVRRAMISCEKGVMISDKELMSNLGFNNWKEFSKSMRCISISYRDSGIGFNSTIRESDGSYSFRSKGFEALLDSGANDVEIGDLVLKLCQRCI